MEIILRTDCSILCRTHVYTTILKSGQTPVRQPDANALSKLTYYCSLKPPKLSKIAAALLKRAQSDAAYYHTSRAKARLCITLVIVKRLIEDCRSDLTYFARECISIIDVAASVVENTPFGQRRPNMDIIERAIGAVSYYIRLHCMHILAHADFLVQSSTHFRHLWRAQQWV